MDDAVVDIIMDLGDASIDAKDALRKNEGSRMPKGPRGEKRPADAIGLAAMIGKIAAGEVEDERDDLKSAAAELGSKGGKARAVSLSSERRREIARMAAKTRWADPAQARSEKTGRKEPTSE